MKKEVLHIDSELLRAAEAVLAGSESLPAFVEASIRAGIAHRRAQYEFLARGLASRDEARRTGKYISVPEVLTRLDEVLRAKRCDMNPR